MAAQSPAEVIEQTSQHMIDALAENRASFKGHPEIIYNLIKTIVLPGFDVDYVVRLILGKYWRLATSRQRSRFTRAFETLAINSYAKALLAYSGEKIQVQPIAGKPSQVHTLLVHSLMQRKNNPSIEINYRMRKTGSGWKVIDFTVEGISLILNYKHSFAEQIQNQGLDALTSSIEHKNAAFRL